ncbi:DUF2752 domain-containing protein [Nocardioides bruguierae]|uniref:DUF2752 domain-containing protein n=1 Tax=Nocardioides bruguierae TaxID=2945102 RepID=A0A9X2IHA3_9ACTN|nr:DUF2752 domain-containing protein [Nocardioides bruguierae]MCL8027560.1 DUF2752 domain-containing protein [Nocardioides bruguierae]MCM0621580.1 DUF2752 domain-containing protein [Nocardioides bruguierae]
MRLAAPLLTIGTLGAATLALHVRDPHAQGSWGICPSAALGFWCPGCGGLRAVNDLTHGDVAAAFSSNALAVSLMPLAVLGLLLWVRSSWQGRRDPATVLIERGGRPLVVVGVVVIVAFTLLRNLPVAPGLWLAP